MTLFRVLSTTFVLALPLCASAETVPADEFLSQLRALCGRAFEGRLVEGNASDERFRQERLVMHVRVCDEEGVRIPFQVGADRSRTWVLSRTAQGLRLKHEHRHEDGSADQVTRYGGDSRAPGTATRQDFPADAYTGTLLPASASNVWSLELVPGERFSYALRRENRRFRVEFDLRRPVAVPPAPWGAGEN